MLKMKQTTLFSLKSWKKAVTDDVLKYKKVLESKTLSEEVILKTLACLKQKKITKESISSAGIGEILKTLAKGSNLKVAHEARSLIKYWNLEIIPVNQTSTALSISESCVNNETQSDIEIIEVQTPIESCKPVIECSKTTQEQVAKLNPKLHSKDQPLRDTFQVTEKLFEKELSDRCSEGHIALVKNKEKAFIGIPRRELKRRLGEALDLFTQALGEQEVKVYLNNSNIC